MNKLDNNLLSIICILIGMSIFSIQDVLIRILSDDVSTLQILFTRSIVGSLLLIAYLKIQNIKINFSTSYPLLTVFRGIIFLFGFALFYVGLANLSFAICTSLFFTAPFFVTILSKVFLGESIGIRRWLTVIFGFLGVLIIADPFSSELNYYMVFPILCALCYAGAMIIIKVTSDKDNVYAQTFHFYLTAMILCPISAMIGSLFNLHDPSNEVTDFIFRSWSYNFDITLLMLILVGLTAVIAFVFTISAYRLGKPYIVAPFEYILLVWAVIYGRIIWGETISLQSWVGIVIIVTGGIYIFYRERVNEQILATDQTIR
ncbi:MAG: hypothetical protein CMI87_01875 [Pelagibacteraceae bacterium]|nr:hypothetical protein [Pelagibacteraceae bacterium]|tara:strand:- start:749 stop:1699 length:951 start_codon:yes stop_codon:yes gene_type:complete